LLLWLLLIECKSPNQRRVDRLAFAFLQSDALALFLERPEKIGILPRIQANTPTSQVKETEEDFKSELRQS
jgi:hypothetical protein